MIIRPETAADIEGIFRLNAAAFESDAEAQLVNRLRLTADPFVSLVAESEGELCGYILFTPVTAAQDPRLKLLGLAPMAVSPSQQRRGIGSALVNAGLEQARKRDCVAVVVLGHPEYYPKFGFQPASKFGLCSDYDVPDEVFMALELLAGSLQNISGRISYHPVFAG